MQGSGRTGCPLGPILRARRHGGTLYGLRDLGTVVGDGVDEGGDLVSIHRIAGSGIEDVCDEGRDRAGPVARWARSCAHGGMEAPYTACVTSARLLATELTRVETS